jgi:hypothetical protein
MTEDESPTDINVLMSLDPNELTHRDLDQIIAYERKQRAQRESGARVKKPKGETPQIDIKALLGSVPKPAPSGPTMKRRL